jgi:hypothetical protein
MRLQRNTLSSLLSLPTEAEALVVYDCRRFGGGDSSAPSPGLGFDSDVLDTRCDPIWIILDI